MATTPVRADAIDPDVRTFNYISVPPGTTWGWRTIADFELILVVAGRYAYERHDAPPVAVAQGEILTIPPAEAHLLRRVDTGGRSILSCLHLEFVAGRTHAAGEYRLPVPFQRVTPAVDLPVFLGLFKRGADTFAGVHPYRRALAGTIAREIGIRLLALWEGDDRRPRSRRMEAMLAFLRQRLARPVGRRDLAEAFHITPEYVNALFQREIGMTPTQFLQRERVYRAYRHLQEDGLSVKQAAARVGMPDPFHFSRVFRRIVGLPPSQVAGRGARPPDRR